MGRIAIASAALALTGCELVFSLEPSPRDADPGRGDASADAGGADADPCGVFDEDDDDLPDLCDSCPTVAPSGTDGDQDGLDDGCDPRLNGDDRVVAFFGFNQPFAADGWSIVYGGGTATVTVEDGSLRIQTGGDMVIALPGSMPAAYTVEVRAAYGNAQSSKLAVFHHHDVAPQNLGDGRWCFVFQSGAPTALVGWELLSDGEAVDTAYEEVPTPTPLVRFRLGAFRDTTGTVGCTWDGEQRVPAAVMFSDHHGPALFAQVGQFYVDSLVLYEHL
jgi:hypothetical protein